MISQLLSVLATICLAAQASAAVMGECSLDASCKANLAERSGDGNDISENELLITEATYSVSSPAPETEGLGADLGEPQEIDALRTNETMNKIEEARRYIRDEVMVQDKYEKVRKMCVNKHASCTYWSLLGECEKNPGYMQVHCAPVCGTCEMLHVETRCPLDPDAVDALYPGDLNTMFERLAYSGEYQEFEPVVLSKPPEGPWMIMFENAVTEDEANRLIELGGNEGYERSSDVGIDRGDGTYTQNVNNGRTSTNAWCVGDCYKDPVAQRVMQRIENITGIPEVNSENLQLLRYDQSQFYQTHSDYIPYQVERPSGVRILTFYMYLNDVEEGGGTNFPALDLTVTPKRGRAVLWPSVLNENPNKKDSRTNHQAMPVIKGLKYGANAWVHQRDYKTNNDKGC